MSNVDMAAVTRRRNVMMVAVVVAAATAIGSIILYFKFAQSWALVSFVLALLMGFGAQIWFIAGLRRKGA